MPDNAATNSKLVSSPLATGGAGTIFEQYVNAYLLTLLLVHGIPPILTDCYVSEVSLQTERLGVSTDDFLLLGTTADATVRKLLGQVKRTFKISASDKECKKTITDCWIDFNGRNFEAARDRFAIVTLRGTTVLLEHFCGLLDAARVSNDGAEFATRLATKGLLSQKCSDYCDVIREIVSASEGREVSTAEVWPFLRVLHLFSLDLGTITGQVESHAKTMLAHACSENDRVAAADVSWNALVKEAGEGMGQARTYRLESLSQQLRTRHTPIQHKDQMALKQLRQHSASVLQGIRTTLGEDIHLSRGEIVLRLTDLLSIAKVVIVSGAAGSGKSGIAKDAILALGEDMLTFSFRAEELACSHFDETLTRSKIDVSSETLGAILAGQARKILLVESIERLLEKSVREAFGDLLRLVREDPTWQLILTCRDYSTAQVKSLLLEAYALDHAILEVPELTNEELEEVVSKCPGLSRPLQNDSLRRLLRTPYLLDKAIQMPWTEERSLPESERAFRLKFWTEIIQNNRTTDGLHIKRERTFVEIALRRARALTMYADGADLEASVLQSLTNDSLIVSSENSTTFVAPAHDVLEDWAILHWIDDNFVRSESSLPKLCELIGTHPAVRRAFRKWISELLETDAANAEALFKSLIGNKNISLQFCDDTFVCFLRSSTASDFLHRHETILFENKKELLHRVIHLLRVACVAPPEWLGGSMAHLSILNAPDSVAWASVLQIVNSRLVSFGSDEALLLLGLIDDWSRSVSWNCTYPEGAKSAAAIGYHLLEQFDGYGFSDQRKRVLKVLAKIPNADPERFVSILTNQGNWGTRDLICEELRRLIFEELDSMPACRDLPDSVISAFTEFLFTEEERSIADFPEPYDDGFSPDNGRLFGLKHACNLEYYPASAFKGPFFHLLRHHPDKGLELLVTIFNQSAQSYKDTYIRQGQSVHTIELTFPDGGKRTQICDPALWSLYRGQSSGPHVLQSGLMALELVLLERGQTQDSCLDDLLVNLLAQSDSAAITAVVASVATAYPELAGETLLVLLNCRECVMFDRRRMSQDLLGSLNRIFPDRDMTQRIYYDERIAADSRSHRRGDLEWAIKAQQFGVYKDRIQTLIDKHLSNLPPVAEQSEYQRLWRLSLHRMDLRRYTIEEVVEDGAQTNNDSQGEKQVHLLMTAKAPTPDLQEIVNNNAVEQQEFNRLLQLQMWGHKVFFGEDAAEFDPILWRERLEEAKVVSFDSPSDPFHYARTGATCVAAVCIRYHWDELDAKSQKWCIGRICSEVESDCNVWNRLGRVQKGVQGGTAAAWVLSSLIGKQLHSSTRKRITRCLVLALTHPSDEIRIYAAWGVGAHLWKIDKELAMRCINAIASEARLVEHRRNEQSQKPYKQRLQIEVVECNTAKEIRKGFFDDSVVAANAYETLDTTGGFGALANCRIMSILGKVPHEPLSVRSFRRLSETLVDWWHADDSSRRGRGRDFGVESQLVKSLKDFVFGVNIIDATSILEPILSAVDRHPDKIHGIVEGLIIAEDDLRKTDHFWSLWQLFADQAVQASWMQNMNSRHPFGEAMVYALFFPGPWKQNVRHWKSLEGYSDRVDNLFERLPSCPIVLHSYCNFLYHIGERSLPHAFSLISESLTKGICKEMLIRKEDTIFMLETLLQRHVYGKPIELKKTETLRCSVLFLLDQLIENGSSAAYRMRDDFVTPISLAMVGV